MDPTNALVSLFDRLVSWFGLDAKRFPQSQQKHQAILVWLFCCVAVLTWASHVPLYALILKNSQAMIYCLAVGLPTSVLGLILVKMRWIKAAAISCYFFGSATLFLVATVTGGAWSPVLLWMVTFLLAVFLTQGILDGIIYTAVISPLLFLFVAFVDQVGLTTWSFGFQQFDSVHRLFLAGTYAGAVCVVAYLSYIFENRVSQAFRRSEKARLEADQQRQLAEQARQGLEEQIAENKSLINAAEIGYCMIYNDLKIVPSKTSSYFRKLFPEALHFRQILKQLHLEGMHDLIQSVLGESELTWELNEASFITEAQINGMTHELGWRRVVGHFNETAALIFVARNIQPILDSKLKMETVSRFAKLLVTIVGDQDDNFRQDRERKSKRVMKAIKRQIPQIQEAIERAELSLIDNWQPIFITLHTLKGEMSSFGFHELKEHLHHGEDIVKAVKDISEAPQQNTGPLAKIQEDLLQSLRHILERLEEIRQCCQQIGADQTMINLPRETLLAAHNDPKRLQELINHSLFEDLHRTVVYFETEIFKVAGDLGKPTPRLVVNVPRLFISEFAEEKLKQAFTHVIRNALDHGIESRAERQRKGKPECPEITVSGRKSHLGVELSIHDDGRGLDLQAIETKARKQLLITGQQKMSREEIADLIFVPGFSTSDFVSLISGRGMGMDAVRKYIGELGGRATITLLDQSTCPAWELVLFIPPQHFPFDQFEQALPLGA
ncbi:ATP-binding protein [Oligoflexus tunisiensis]|uniref:ATP-binding protein n=1 Tax=Oligoflexus tunisiensis TaxID=708132 RepID=UPI00159F21F7|nr:ATP-binding protein [Oligoflexus tunisiensis]